MGVKWYNKTICCLPNTQIGSRHKQVKSERIEVFHTNNNKKTTEVAILISVKRDFKKVIRGKEINYLLIEGSIKQEEYNNYKHLLPNNRPLKYMKQKLTELRSEIIL